MKPLLLDVMLGDKFVCQLCYRKRGWPRLIDGKVVEVHDYNDLKRYVFEQRPSLRDKEITISISNQKILQQ